MTHMERLINVFDIELTGDSAKETVRKIAVNLEEERIYTVGIVTLEMLVQEKDNDIWKGQLKTMDVLFPGDKEILRAACETDRSLTKESDKKDFAKLLFRYLQKNKKTVFLLTETEAQLEIFQNHLKKYSQNLRIVGKGLLGADGINKEKIINEINGLEPDCILAALSCPWQAKFISENKALLNTRVWVGLGPQFVQEKPKRKTAGRIRTYILKKLFHYQLEKQAEE